MNDLEKLKRFFDLKEVSYKVTKYKGNNILILEALGAPKVDGYDYASCEFIFNENNNLQSVSISE